MIRSLLAAVAALAAVPAFALNHTLVVNPIAPAGPNTVACSNLAQDVTKMIAGATPTDYWEGHLVNDKLLYVDQILAAPETALRFDALVPDDRSIYPNTANTRVPFVAIVCHPTPATNADPDYPLPGSTDVVPHMQPVGAAPSLASGKWPLAVYSHGLGGSPVGKGYLQSIALLASHGYIVAAVFHADNRFSRVRVEDLGDYWYLLTQYDRVAEMELMRPVALKALVDTLLAHPAFNQAIDAERIAGFGASLGGQAMLNLMGAKMTTSIGLACRVTVRDDRIKLAVGFVPYAGQTFLPAFCDDQSGADGVTRPFLALSGTADTTAPVKMVRQAVNRFKGSRYLVELIDGQHELRPEDIGDLFTWMITFYKAYLQADAPALASFIRMNGVMGGREDHMTIDAHVPTSLAAGEVRVAELRNDSLDRYATQTDTSVAAPPSSNGWSPTGYSFKAWAQPLLGADAACHYEGALSSGSQLYGECGWTKRLGRWVFESTGGFFIEKADPSGNCRDGLLAVNRVFNPRFALSRTASSQRLVTSDSAARDMMANGWAALPTTMCARP